MEPVLRKEMPAEFLRWAEQFTLIRMACHCPWYCACPPPRVKGHELFAWEYTCPVCRDGIKAILYYLSGKDPIWIGQCWKCDTILYAYFVASKIKKGG